MKLKFIGASGGIVTGSSYLITLEHMNVLVDCGMFQGQKETREHNYDPFPYNPSIIDYVLLTHAHLDHVGLLPKLVKEGFNGGIICTDATKSIAEIILQDSAHLQESDRQIHGRRRHELDEDEAFHHEPLYTQDDIAAVMARFQTHKYGEQLTLKDIKVRMREAGHILGSSSFEVWYKNSVGRDRKIVFSGDLGQTGARIIRDPDFIREADYVVMESTYGGRNHKDRNSTLIEMLSILQEASRTKSRVVIPTFAVERAQELLYEMNLLVEKKVLKGLKYYLDSPMAIKTTEVFRAYRKYYDEDALNLLKNGDDPFSFRGLEYTQDTYQSKRIVSARSAVIMAGSGMCTGGRVLHHLKNTLPHKDAHIMFVGFQVPGTLGRKIIDGAKVVRIHGQEFPVNAQIHTLNGFSAHADQNDLLYWLRSFGHSPREVFITHGDNKNRTIFEHKVQEELHLNTNLPEAGDEVELD